MIDEIEEETSLNESTPNPEAEKRTPLEELEKSKTSTDALPEDSTPAFMEGFRNSWGEKPTRKIVREIIETALLALLVFMAIRVLVHNYQVDGLSMYPTLDNGEYVIVNKWSYSSINVERFSNVIPGWTASSDSQEPIFGKIERGDIVVFKCGNDSFERIVKKARKFNNVDKILDHYDVKDINPGVNTVEELKLMYNSYPNYTEKLKKYGIIAFELLE